MKQIFFNIQYPNCNQKCIYCDESKKHDKHHIEVEIISECLQALFIDHEIELTIEGGEWLLNIETLKTILSFGLPSRLITNGTLIIENKDFFLNLPKNLIKITVSIDGTEETHNANRKMKNGNKTWDLTYNGIQFLRENNIPFYTNSVVTEIWLKNAQKNYLFLKDLGQKQAYLTAQYFVGNDIYFPDKTIALYTHLKTFFDTNKIKNPLFVLKNVYDTSQRGVNESSMELYFSKIIELHYGYTHAPFLFSTSYSDYQKIIDFIQNEQI